jgi:outer membrane protein assembly factor BamB
MSTSLNPAAALALLAFLVPHCVSIANDWPQWRGPNRDGVSTEVGLLKEWPAAGPPLLWKATGLGQGYSTVSVLGNSIVTTGDKANSSHLVALNSEGKTLWSVPFGKAGAPGWGGFEGPRSTPTLDGDRIFAVSQWGEFVCVESATGKLIWRKDCTADFAGPRPEWGYSESPLVDAEKVLFTPGGSQGAVVALHKKTGALIWRSKEFTDPAHYSSLIVAEIGGVRQYVQLTEDSVAGIAAADGKLLWRAPRRGSTAVVPTPIYRDGLVYVTSGYAIGCNLFKVTANGGHFSAEQLYANKVMANHHGGVVQRDDAVYGYSDGKGWTCQDLRTGKAVWQERQQLGKGSLVYADGHLYLRVEEGRGTVALLEATPQGYRQKGRFDPPNRTDKNSWAHPVVANGRLYLRDQDTLLCYDVKAK